LGVEVVTLEPIPTLRGTFGSDILQGNTEQSHSLLRSVGRASL